MNFHDRNTEIGKSWDPQIELFRFCIEHGIHEILTKEYVEAFSNYLSSSIQKYGRSSVLLEVGAGNGKLMHEVQQRLGGIMALANMRPIATDSYNWNIKPNFPVEKLDVFEALEKYNPAIVISSWMPSDEDWTEAFRKTSNLKEYILIGPDEPDGTISGTEDTWNSDVYEKEGFVRKDLNEISQYQVSRMNVISDFDRSTTVSFTRT